MTSVRRALALSMAERYLLVLLALASNMVVARLLTPEEIGLYAVALAVIGMSHMVREFGIGSYLIQHPTLEPRHVHTAFGVSLLLGGGIFAVLFLGAPAVSGFYGDERVGQALRIASINFLVLPFCSITLSLLRRDMRFDSLALIAVSAGLLGTAATLVLAWAGLGPNGLAIGSVVLNVATGIGGWLALRDPAVFKPAFGEWRAVLSFGGQSALTNVVGSISNNINDLALGKILGFAPTAMISRAQGLPALFQRELMRSLQVVAFPAFAQAHREGANVERKWILAVGSLSVFAWPFYGFVALTPLELIRLMFGTQWDAAAPLVPIFCAAGAVLVLSSFIQQLLVAVGRIDLNTGFELAYQPLRAVTVVGVAVHTRSLQACAWTYLAFSLIQVPWAFAVKARCSTADWPSFARQMGCGAIVSLLTLLPPMCASLAYGVGRVQPMPVGVLLLTAAASVLAWLAALRMLNHPILHDPLFQKVQNGLTRWLPPRYRRR